MRILVISDSHGSRRAIENAIEAQPPAEHIFFLGDKLEDIEDFDLYFPERTFHTVSGNCDFFGNASTEGICTLGGKKIFYTHGHTYGVKGSKASLTSYARSRGADIALYGHTHIPDTTYLDGLYLVNPGSIGRGREKGCSYAVIDIIGKDILPIIIRI